MKVMQKEGQTTIELEGRLDTITAPEVVDTVEGLEFERLVIELGELQYISSAGLRALLVCQKRAEELEASMEVQHPSKAVLDVMRLSGFHKMITVREE